MSKKISILALECVSASGIGTNAIINSVSEKKLPQHLTKSIPTPEGPKDIHFYQIPNVNLGNLLPEAVQRRMGRLAHFFIYCVNEIFKKTDLKEKDKTRIGLVIGSAYGPISSAQNYLKKIVRYGAPGASPTLFAGSVHNSIASQISLTFNIQGPCTTITCGEQTVASALDTAIGWLNSNELDYVLLAIGDEYVDVANYYIASSVFAQKETSKVLKPFHSECSYLPGEGVSVFLLSKDQSNNRLCAIDSHSFNQVVKTHSNYTILSCSGNQNALPHFQEILPPQSNVLCFSPQFGSFPTSQALDLALAAQFISNKKINASTVSDQLTPYITLQEDTHLNDYDQITCENISEFAERSSITLSL